MRLTFCLGSGILLACLNGFAAAESHLLEQDGFSLDLAGGRALGALRDAATGRDWLDAAVRSPVYSVLTVGAKTPFTSLNATAVRVRREGGSTVVEGEHGGVTVVCTYRPEPGGTALLGRVSVRSREPVRLSEVRFPVLNLRLPFSGTGAGDRVLFPECDGTLLSDPCRNKPDRRFPYPGNASLQLLAAYDASAGLSLAARDADAHAKAFLSRRNGSALELSIAHAPAQTPATIWELPYEIALERLRPLPGLKEITWESAAERYRAWAVRQPWCARTLEQRLASGDIPRWLAEPNVVVTFSLRGDLPDSSKGVRQPLFAEQMRRWGLVLGAPVTGLVTSWEKRGTWVAPDYFPPLGGELAFADMLRTLRAEGHRSMVFLSGLHWTLEKQVGAERIDQRDDFERLGRDAALTDAKGEPVLKGTPESDIGRAATLCAGTALARAMLTDTARRCQELGIDCVQVDQLVGGGVKECFNPKHEHPPGGGNWGAVSLRSIFAELREAGRRRDPDFAFSIEEPGEFYLPVLDTYHARDLHQGRWPRSGAGILGVPLFTHVYHDYLSGYGSEGAYVSESDSWLALFQMGSNLVCGKVPAVALWSRWVDPEKVREPQLRLLRSHLALWRGEAGAFLVHGRRVALPPLDVTSRERTFTEKDGVKRVLTIPDVLRGGWRLPDGRQGVVYVCVAEKPVRFVCEGAPLELAPGEAVWRGGSPGARSAP